MIAIPSIQRNVADLNRLLSLYVRASGLSIEDVLKKKGTKLGYQLRLEFKSLMPGKGSIREERLAALKAGEGIRVRPKVYQMIAEKFGALPLASGVMRALRKGKVVGTISYGGVKLNLQALAVQKEIKLRESGRGFLGQSAKFLGIEGRTSTKAVSRYNETLSRFGFQSFTTGPEVKFVWGGWSEASDEAVKGIARERGLAAVARALSAVTEDMIPYLERKLKLTAKQMGVA